MSKSKSFLSNQAYDIAVWVVGVIMPALVTCYVTVAQYWGWSNVEEIAGTMTAVIAFLGTVLRISSIQYHKIPKDEEDHVDPEIYYDT